MLPTVKLLISHVPVYVATLNLQKEHFQKEILATTVHHFVMSML